MNNAHWHLALNHLPVIVPLLGLIILVAGFIFRSDIVKRVAFAVVIFGAICTIPAFFTGEGAEEVVEGFPEITKSMIHDHEEIAEVFAILSYLLGGLSLFAFWSNLRQKTFSTYAAIAVVVLSCATLFYAKSTATSGGEIRHTEIRADFKNAGSNNENPGKADDD
jgi:uncharacterized membrane protein